VILPREAIADPIVCLEFLYEPRRVAHEAQQEARSAVSDAVLVADAAGARPADVAAITAQPYAQFADLPIAALTRQGTYKILAERATEKATLWEDADRPDAPTALDNLTGAVKQAIPAIAAWEDARDTTVRAMWKARRAGHGPADVARASRWASKTAYSYLALMQEWDTIVAALGGLMEEADPYGFPAMRMRQYGTLIIIEDTMGKPGDAARIDKALAKIGRERKSSAPEQWSLIRPTATPCASPFASPSR